MLKDLLGVSHRDPDFAFGRLRSQQEQTGISPWDGVIEGG